MADLLIIFARALHPGRVKTRLIPVYGADGALDLYQQLLSHTFTAAADFPGRVELWLDQPDVRLAQQAELYGWPCRQQQGAELGERMEHALVSALTRADRVLLVGSDCPVLSRDYFQVALEALQQRPVVFGPSEDGGYVLLGSGCRELWQPGRFAGVAFGTDQALLQSRGCFPPGETCCLEPLWDVDEPADVARACQLGLLNEPVGQGEEN